MNPPRARITIEWHPRGAARGGRRDFDDIATADTALVRRRVPAVVTLDGHDLQVTPDDLEHPDFSLLDVPFFRDPCPQEPSP